MQAWPIEGILVDALSTMQEDSMLQGLFPLAMLACDLSSMLLVNSVAFSSVFRQLLKMFVKMGAINPTVGTRESSSEALFR